MLFSKISSVFFFVFFVLSVEAQSNRILNIQKPSSQSEMTEPLLDPWTYQIQQPLGNDDHQDSCKQNSIFCIDLDLRTRGEFRHGQAELRKDDDRPAIFISDRARLVLGFQRGLLSAKISGQHSGVWGDSGIEGGSAFSLNEAWAKLQTSKGWFLQVGRQVLSYDDERILGAEDWDNAGYSHDVLRLGLENGLHKVHGIVGYNQSDEKRVGGTYYAGRMPYKNIQSLWYHFGNNTLPLEFSLIAMNIGYEVGYTDNGVEFPQTSNLQVGGAWLQYKINTCYGKLEGYYQMGHDDNKRKISAYLAAARLGYKDTAWGVELGGDYVSGSNSSSTQGTNHCFNLLYGSSHVFFGAMDYFTSSNMYSCGLLDVMGKAYVKPIKNGYLNVDYHYFMTGVKRKQLHRQLGHEVDIRLGYDIYKDVCIEAGYSIMMPTSVMVYFQGSGSTKCLQNWGWLSLNFSPRLFSSKR